MQKLTLNYTHLQERTHLLIHVHGHVFILSILWSAVCVKTQDDAGIYNSCWYLRFMLVFTKHAGIYTSCWYRKYQHES